MTPAQAVATYDLAYAAANVAFTGNAALWYYEVSVGADVYVFVERDADGIADQVVRLNATTDAQVTLADII